jgi:uncharacterized protein YjbI with pentapeptide repeats
VDQNDTGTEAPRTFIGRFIDELVPDWRPTREQVLWATRLTVAVILALTVIALLGVVLWVVLSIYINPRTATERKDLVQSFAIVVAGAVGSLSALAAVGNLYVSRRNLQQQRELELERAQEDALPAYLDQMIQLLNDEQTPLRQAKRGDEVSILARVRTLTVLPRLDGNRKASVMQFLYEAGLIRKDHTLVDLTGADLRGAYLHKARLRGVDLRGADLRGADLSGVDLGGANLSEANLSKDNLSEANLGGAKLDRANLHRADLSGTNLTGADLTGADLIGAILRRAQLSTATLMANLNEADLSDANLFGANFSEASLRGATGWTEEQLAEAEGLDYIETMPDGQEYEDWIKTSKGKKYQDVRKQYEEEWKQYEDERNNLEGRGEDGENSGP